jgi:hypothetical protein
MVATNDCAGQVQAIRMRVTKLDSNGVPTPGAQKMYVTSALVVATLTPVYEDGTSIEEMNGEGVLCVTYYGPSSFKRVDVSLQICTPDPELLEMLTGGTRLTDDPSGAVGYAVPAIGVVEPTPVSVEIWAKRVEDGQLVDVNPYSWWVLPRVRNLRLEEAELGNSAFMPTVTGQAFENANWYDGPLNDWPVASDRAMQWMPCGAAQVPSAVCGYQTVVAS